MFPRSNSAHAATFNMCQSPQAFLDQRGEEYDDWFDKDALIVKAQECEVNTGRAADPPRLQPDQTQVTHCKRLLCGAKGRRNDRTSAVASNPQRVVRRAGRG